VWEFRDFNLILLQSGIRQTCKQGIFFRLPDGQSLAQNLKHEANFSLINSSPEFLLSQLSLIRRVEKILETVGGAGEQPILGSPLPGRWLSINQINGYRTGCVGPALSSIHGIPIPFRGVERELPLHRQVRLRFYYKEIAIDISCSAVTTLAEVHFT
jgi:hypothetical protein